VISIGTLGVSEPLPRQTFGKLFGIPGDHVSRTRDKGFFISLHRHAVCYSIILWSPASATNDVHDENDREQCGLVEEEERLSNDSLSLGQVRAAIPTR